MTTPPTPQDAREIAAAAVASAGRCDHPGAETCDPWWIADAVLAAVEPVIRQQALEAFVETAETLAVNERLNAQRYGVGSDTRTICIGAQRAYAAGARCLRCWTCRCRRSEAPMPDEVQVASRIERSDYWFIEGGVWHRWSGCCLAGAVAAPGPCPWHPAQRSAEGAHINEEQT